MCQFLPYAIVCVSCQFLNFVHIRWISRWKLIDNKITYCMKLSGYFYVFCRHMCNDFIHFYWIFIIFKREFKKKINKLLTYIFGIWILSASFCLPKSCQGLDLVVCGLLPMDVVGLFWLWCTILPRTIPATDEGIVPLLASKIPAGWHNSV